MPASKTRQLAFKLLMLSVLLGCLAIFSQPVKGVYAQCSSCDETYYLCRINGVYSLDQCRNDYLACTSTCAYRDPYGGGGGGGGGGGCGIVRSPCEQACNEGRRDCLDNGGDTCGADYQACMTSCCSR
jgi:hypothetical protein